MNNKFQLEMLTGPTPGKIFPIADDQVIGGREPSCDIVINDAEISRKHFRLVWSDPGYILEDLGSTNGILVNEVKMNTPQGLHGGEKLSLGGKVVLEYRVIPIELEETIIFDNVELPPEHIDDLVEPIETEPGDNDQELFGPDVEPIQDELSSTEVPMEGSELDPTQKRSKKKKILLITLIIMAVVVIGLLIICLYTAPTSFWCENFPFIFKPEIYPVCAP